MNTAQSPALASRRRALFTLAAAPAVLIAGCGRKGPLFREQEGETEREEGEQQVKPKKDAKDTAQ